MSIPRGREVTSVPIWLRIAGAVLTAAVALEALGLRPVVMRQWQRFERLETKYDCETCVRWCIEDSGDTAELCFARCQRRGECRAPEVREL